MTSGTPVDGAAQRRGGPSPRLAIVIVSHNAAGHLARCLESLERERSDFSFEVVVVDNASTDGAVRTALHQFPWVRVHLSAENRGFAWACNRGTELAPACDYLLYLNPDTVIPAGALPAVVAALDAETDVGMLGCKLVRPDGALDHACKRGFPTPLSSIFYFLGLTRLWPESPTFAHYTAGHLDPDQPALVDAVNGAFMLVRRTARDDVGPLDEGFWMYMEDLDWCYRFWQAGWPVLYWPAVEVVHVKGASSGRYRTWRINHAFHSSMWRYYRKHYAPARPVILTALVWTAVWAKFSLSATRNSVVRRWAG